MKDAIRKLLKKLAHAAYYAMTVLFPVRRRVVVFNSNVGRNYTGNPKAIFEELRAQGADSKLGLKFVWTFYGEYLAGGMAELPHGAKCVRYGYLKYHYYMAVAGAWVFDGRQEDYLVKRKKCIYLQTWHGTPLKKLGLDLQELHMSGEERISTYRNRVQRESVKWDGLLAQNDFSAETFRKCFGYDGEMLKYGYPRNDVLIKKNGRKYIEYLKRKHGIPLGKKVLLYAPTWRDDRYKNNGKYEFCTELDYALMEKVLGQHFVLLVKAHYLVGMNEELRRHKEFVRMCRPSDDIAELYLMADALITDYSSVMFDYCVLKKPMFFYAYDLESYRDSLRGFYFDFVMEAPGPITRTTEELVESIDGFLCESAISTNGSGRMNYASQKLESYPMYAREYGEKYSSFFEKYAKYDDGNAASRAAGWLVDRIGVHSD